MLSGLKNQNLIPLKMIRFKDWTENECKPGELTLKTTLKNDNKVWLLGSETLKNEGLLKTSAQFFMGHAHEHLCMSSDMLSIATNL